jgi:tRNA(fMet)-specific endonuclease VapC
VSHPAVLRRVLAAPMWSLSNSAITEAELAFGLARRPAAHKLRAAIQEFRKRVDALP